MTTLAPETRESLVFRRPGERAWLRVEAAATDATVLVNGEEVGRHLGAWTPFEFEITGHLRDENEAVVIARDVAHATNGFLPVLGLRWTGVRGLAVRSEPTRERAPAPQRARVDGTKLLVDGEPCRVRGVLHWGSYPELGRPWPGEEQMRREINDLRGLGFNLIKLCLWVPPARYYELCDELGMLVWQEYPVWDAPLDDLAIAAEYEELFRHDAPYPCVILRTLTCENDHVDHEVGRELVALCRRTIPDCVVLDNSSWLCAEREGDFHDEHIYVHNAQWRYYGERMRGRLTKPLLLGETMSFDTDPEGPGGSAKVALEARRWQIETLARDLPDAGYVITGLRDVDGAPLGLFTRDGRPKYTPEEWRWHGEDLGPPREVPELAGEVIGPRKGQWKHREHLWWSPVVKVLGDDLPAGLIERECMFDLLAGRVLDRCEGTRVLVELWDYHDAKDGPRKHPLVIEFETEGERRVVSAFRRDTPAGRELWDLLQARTGPAPEIGPLFGDAIVLEDWEMSLDERTWIPVKCDTPLVNRGRNVFEGRAIFRTTFESPGGPLTLHCEAVGDWFECLVDGETIGEAGPRHGTWDGTRDIPREYALDLAPGEHEVVFHVRDWRAAGGMVGPVYLATDLEQRIF